MAIDLVAILTATPGKEAELETAMNSLANNVKSGEPKTERYKLYKRINSEGGNTELVVIERYPDAAAVAAHQQTSHYKDAIALGEEKGLLAKPMVLMALQACDGGFDMR